MADDQKKSNTEVTMFDASSLVGWNDMSDDEKDAVISKMAENIRKNILKDEPDVSAE